MALATILLKELGHHSAPWKNWPPRNQPLGVLNRLFHLSSFFFSPKRRWLREKKKTIKPRSSAPGVPSKDNNNKTIMIAGMSSLL